MLSACEPVSGGNTLPTGFISSKWKPWDLLQQTIQYCKTTAQYMCEIKSWSVCVRQCGKGLELQDLFSRRPVSPCAVLLLTDNIENWNLHSVPVLWWPSETIFTVCSLSCPAQPLTATALLAEASRGPQCDLQKPTCPQCGLKVPEHRALSLSPGLSQKQGPSSSVPSSKRSRRNVAASHQPTASPAGRNKYCGSLSNTV